METENKSEIGLKIKSFMKKKSEQIKQKLVEVYENTLRPSVAMLLLKLELSAFKVVEKYHAIVEDRIQKSIDDAQAKLTVVIEVSRKKAADAIAKQEAKIEALKKKHASFIDLHPIG